MNSRLPIPGHRQRGFSILEVLITVMIAAIALAALAQLQLNSVRTNHGALLTSYSAMHARDIAERIVANAAGAASLAGITTVVAHYHYDLFNATLATTPPAVNSACQTNSTACTPALRAQTDYAEWLQSISSDMPAGTRAQVCLSVTPVTYSFTNPPDCDASSTTLYSSGTTYLQRSFPITYYVRIEYPLRNTTLGLIMPVELDAFSMVKQ